MRSLRQIPWSSFAIRSEESNPTKTASRFCHLLEVIGIRPLRFVSLDIHHAQKAEWLVLACLELVPGHRWDLHHILQGDFRDLVADEHLSRSANDDDQVGVLMPLQRRVSSRPDFKVSELYGQIMGAAEKDLPRHAFEDRAVFLVGQDFDILPGEIAFVTSDHL
jgi:hypothetical protein